MVMWTDSYAKLKFSEQEIFRRINNLLLSSTFLIRDIPDPKGGVKINPDYQFVERKMELFQQYLQYGGWTFQKDSNYGVIFIKNNYGHNRVRLDKNTTLILLSLRLIFEEEREKVTLSNKVVTQTGMIIQKMNALGLINRKPSLKELADSLKQLSSYDSPPKSRVLNFLAIGISLPKTLQ